MIVAPFFPREFDNKILQQNNFIIGPLGPPVVVGFVNSSAYSFLRARAHFGRSSVSANGFRCDSVSIAFSFFRCVRISIRGLVRRSVRPLVGPSVGWSVGRSVMLLSKLMENGLLRILNDLDSAGQGKKRDKEEGGTRGTEGRRGRRDKRKEGQGEGRTRRVKKRKSC